MATDLEFTKEADAFMAEVLDALDEFDPDDVDAQLAMGVLTMEFRDGTKCIMNRQTAAHQIWLAEGATAWHFEKDETTNTWVDTKGRGDLKAILSDVLSRRLERAVSL
jgi:CyaY protein